MPRRTRVVCAATRGEDGQRLEPVPVGTGRLATALDSPGLGPAVRLEVLAEHDVVGDDDPVDAGQRRRPARGRTTWSQPPGSSAAYVGQR